MNLKKIVRIVRFSLILYSIFFVQFIKLQSEVITSAELSDTVKKKFPEISVEADRVVPKVEFDFQSADVINRQKIVNSGAYQINQILSGTSGLFIKDYGGMGGLKLISIRGLSSSNTIILLDGIALNSSQSSSIDLSSLPVGIINNIEIVKSGSSFLYGGLGSSGVLNITSNQPEQNGIQANLGIGSFNEFQGGLSVNNSIGKLKFLIGAEFTGTDGRYPFHYSQFGYSTDTMRLNADYRNINLYLLSTFNLLGWDVNNNIFGRFSDKGVPGAVTQGFIESSDSRMNEKEFMWTCSAKKMLIDLSLLSFNFNIKAGNLNYTDSNSLMKLINGTSTKFISNEYKFTTKYSKSIDDIDYNLLFDAGYSELSGNMLQKNTGSYVNRLSSSIAGNLIWNFISDSTLNSSVFTAVRYDVNSKIRSALSPSFGLNLKLNRIPMTIKGTISSNFRLPSFNEMYYLNYGNPDIKPEKSLSIDLGCDYLIQNKFLISLTAFLSNINDYIQTVYSSEDKWTTKNVSNVKSKGLEFSMNYSIFDNHLNLSYNHTLEKVVYDDNSYLSGKILEYTPQEMINVKLYYSDDTYYSSISFEHNSFLYSLADNSFSSIIPSSNIFNFNCSIKFIFSGAKLKLRLDIMNLTDERYSIITNYPMPGRIIRFGLGAEI